MQSHEQTQIRVACHSLMATGIESETKRTTYMPDFCIGKCGRRAGMLDGDRPPQYKAMQAFKIIRRISRCVLFAKPIGASSAQS